MTLVSYRSGCSASSSINGDCVDVKNWDLDNILRNVCELNKLVRGISVPQTQVTQGPLFYNFNLLRFIEQTFGL